MDAETKSDFVKMHKSSKYTTVLQKLMNNYHTIWESLELTQTN